MAGKIKVGFFSFTCCEGCVVVFLEVLNRKFDNYMRRMEVENFRTLKKEDSIKKLDIAFIEGAV